MRNAAEWLALLILCAVLYYAHLKHMATSQYNVFLILLLGMVSILVFFLKVRHRDGRSEDPDQEDMS